MVRKRRLMTSFDYRKVFGVTGNDEWVPGVHRGGGQPTSGKPIGIWGGAPPLSGLVGQPKRALCAIGRKINEKKKRRWEKGEGLLLPNLVGLGLEGEGCPQGSAEALRGPWTPRQGSPSSPYIYGGFRADLTQLCHGSPTTYLHGFTSRSCFCGARAEPC